MNIPEETITPLPLDLTGRGNLAQLLLYPDIMNRFGNIRLNWLPSWSAYAVRLDGRVIGLVRCKVPLPFRWPVEFA